MASSSMPRGRKPRREQKTLRSKPRPKPNTAVLHPELLTPDGPAATAFYQGLFGWRFAPVKLPDGSIYHQVLPESGPNTGILERPAGSQPGWALFINVDNLARAVARAKKLGARILAARVQVADFGVYATLQDPTGASFHLWQKKR